jgi:Kdo2-lipid IVA lauroyltransferase/acyltransferase
MKTFAEYTGFRMMVFFFTITPFRLLYGYSGLLSFFLQYIIRYRRKVVERNLRLSFPEKSKEELLRIRKKFYLNLCDVILETAKGYSAKADTIRKRIRVTNPEILLHHYDNKQSCIILISHYGNWEWIPFTGNSVKHINCSLYKPLRNKKVDNKLLKMRGKSGLKLYPMQQAGMMIRSHMNTPALFTFISDQNPAGEVEDEYWVDFLNQKTAVINGAEKMAARFKLPLYYYDLQRIGRGRYEGTLIPVEMHPEKTEKGFVSAAYMKTLESIIRKNPENWLWSHRRWKKTPPPHIMNMK